MIWTDTLFDIVVPAVYISNFAVHLEQLALALTRNHSCIHVHVDDLRHEADGVGWYCFHTARISESVCMMSELSIDE